MSIFKVADLAVRAIDTAWSLADDFTPSQTLREAIAFAQEIRETLLDGAAAQQEMQLEARIDALRRAHHALSTQMASNDPTASAMAAESIGLIERRVDVLVSLLDAGPRIRDVLGGSVGALGPGGLDESPGFRPLAEHPSTTAFITERMRRVAERSLGTPQKQDATVERRARLDERMRVLGQLDHRLAAAAPSTLGAGAAAAAVATTHALQTEIDAASFAYRALAIVPQKRAAPTTRPIGSSGTTIASPPRAGQDGGAGRSAAASVNRPLGDATRSVRRRIHIGH